MYIILTLAHEKASGSPDWTGIGLLVGVCLIIYGALKGGK